MKKVIIPIQVDRDYQPKGWLAAILCVKGTYDFSGRYPFEQKATKLLKEIQAKLRNLPPKSVTSEETVTSEGIKTSVMNISFNIY